MNENLEIIQYNEKYQESYVLFAKKQWGDESYQANLHYLHWLYQDNPFPGKSPSDCLLVVNDSQNVVGCIHKMPIMWRSQEDLVRIPALHNLMVAEECRKGVGLKILSAALSQEEDALILGAQPPLSDFYEKALKCQKVASIWYRAILLPFQVILSQGCWKLFNNKEKNLVFDEDILQKKGLVQKFASYVITFNPGNELLECLLLRLNQNNFQMHIHWTKDFCHWRYFHPKGPKHLLLAQLTNGAVENFLVISLGIRKGQRLARIVEMQASSYTALNDLLKTIKVVLKHLGIGVLMAFCADDKIQNYLPGVGLRPLQQSPGTYFFHRRRKKNFSSFAFNGSGGDFGFEAIQTRVGK